MNEAIRNDAPLSLECSRQFHWMSSAQGDRNVLEELNRRMQLFYGQAEERQRYQTMLNTLDESTPSADTAAGALIHYIQQVKAQTVLEVGCGGGRLYRQLHCCGYEGDYTGVEVANYVIERNRQQHPEATWECATAYAIPFPEASFDVCLSYYVLEHLVYPETGLLEMLRVVKPGGTLLLAFPDFVASGRFASQQTGFTPQKAREKIARRQWLDAAVGLYDSRVRMISALNSAVQKSGPFPINTRPLCLTYPDLMWPDIDAVYIASKQEVAQWGIAQGHKAEFPAGTEGHFAVHALIAIIKSDKNNNKKSDNVR